MAVALDGHSKVTGQSASGPHTLNHTCGGVQRLLLVVFSGMRSSVASWSSSVTFNGAAMTLGAANESAGSTRNVRTEVWYLVNPPGGSSYTLSVTTSSTMQAFSMAAISLTGVDQTSPIGNVGSDAGNKTDYAVGLTTAVANAWLVGGAGIRRGNSTWSPQGSTAEVYEQTSGTSDTNDLVASGNYLVCGAAGSYSLAANADVSNLGVMAGIVVQPAASAPATWPAAELVLPASGVWAF